MKKRVITVKNVTEKQYKWIEKEAKRRGLTISAIIKIWLQDGVDNK